jgi:hypothetical protein
MLANKHKQRLGKTLVTNFFIFFHPSIPASYIADLEPTTFFLTTEVPAVKLFPQTARLQT